MTQFRALFLIFLVALGSTSAEAVKVKAHAGAHSRQHGVRSSDVKDAIFDDADSAVDMDVYAGVDMADSAQPKPAKASVSSSSSKQIVAVINTLDDILASINNEEKVETKNFAEFSKWCTTEIKSFTEALDNAQTVQEQAQVSEKEMTATIAHLSKEVEDLKVLQEELKDTMDQAAAIRDDEKEKYTDEVQLNKQSVKQVQQAIKIVGKVHNKGGFLQNGVVQKLQINEPGESNYVFGIMKGILEKLQKTRAELDAEEKKKVGMDNAFMTTKKGQVESARTERGEKDVKLTETRIALVKAQAQLKRSAKQIAEVTQILDGTNKECDSKKIAWADRQKDRKNEKGAIKQAIDFIKKSGHGASLAQALEASEVALPEVEQAVSFVQLEGVALPEVEPEELSLRQTIADSMRKAMTVGPEDTKGALGVINQLIAVLSKQQSDEDGKKTYCEKELDVKADEKVDANDDLMQLAADAESKKSTIATLVDEVEEMEDSVVDMAASLKEATVIRKKEKASFQAGSKDRELAVKVLRQAMRVLENFYKTSAPPSFMEKPETKLSKRPTQANKPKTWSATKGPRKKIGSNIVIEMLDKVSLEIVQEEKKARKGEAEAQTSFEQLSKETRSETDRLRSDITERVKSKAKLVVQANAVKETVLQRRDDLKAIKGQEKVLKEECLSLLKNYAARKKSRAFEGDQLKDVKDILRGAGGGGSRTSFVESNSLMTDREATLLSDMEAPKASA